jgi:hypothetical protein
MQKSTKRFVTIALALASVAGVSLLGGFASQADGAGAAVNFTVSPSASTGGVTFPDQPVVTLSGVGATANALVTLTISTGPGTLTCTGGTTLNAVNFIASFSGCSIDKAANGYVLKAADATDGGSNTSTSFDITAGTAYKLGFTTQPVSGSAGDLFVGGNIGSPVVTIEDEGGNPAASNPTDNSTSVTLVIAPNPGQGTLNCTNSNPVVVSSGVAIFGLCAINKEDPGSGYTLLASATGLLASELIPEFSDNFDVTYTTAVASQLVFTNQPAPGANETVNASTFPIDVSLEDTFGNLERNNSATDVELSFTGAGTLGWKHRHPRAPPTSPTALPTLRRPMPRSRPVPTMTDTSPTESPRWAVTCSTSSSRPPISSSRPNRETGAPARRFLPRRWSISRVPGVRPPIRPIWSP